MCKILLCECYQNARKNLWCRKCDDILDCRIFFHSTKFSKNLWRRRYVWREIFRNTEYFFILRYLKKKEKYFPRNSEKLFWWHIWPIFRKRRRLVPKVNIGNFFYFKLDAKYSQNGKIFWQFCNFWLNMLIRVTFGIVLIHVREFFTEYWISHIFATLFILITLAVRVKMFHISKITCTKYPGASPWHTIWGIAVVRLKIHHPVCTFGQQTTSPNFFKIPNFHILLLKISEIPKFHNLTIPDS